MRFKSLAIGVGLGVSIGTFAKTSSSSVPDYALPSCNYGDLALNGYCQGVSAVHAFSRLSAEKIRKGFGEQLSQEFQKNPAQDEDAAFRLLRAFSLLQMSEKFSRFSSGRPQIPNSEAVEMSTGEWGASDMNTRKKSNAMMDKNYAYMQTPQGQQQGLFAGVMVTSSDFDRKLGGHSLYIVSARKEGDSYVFRYLDPNHPQTLNTLTYDRSRASTTFSSDGAHSRYVLLLTYDADTAYRIYQESLDDMKKKNRPTEKAILSFLRLPGGDAESDKYYGKQAHLSDPKVFGEWYKFFGSQINNALKERTPQAGERISSLLGMAAQNQLDAGCDRLMGFLQNVLQELLKYHFQGSEVEKGGIRNNYFPSYLITSIEASTLLFDRVVAWVAGDSPDGMRSGVAPAKNVEQETCIQNKILPEIASWVERYPQVDWSVLLPENYGAWLIKNSDFSTDNAESLKILDGNFSHLSPDGMLGSIDFVLSEGNEAEKRNALQALKRLDGIHENIRTQWLQEAQKSWPPKSYPAAWKWYQKMFQSGPLRDTRLEPKNDPKISKELQLKMIHSLSTWNSFYQEYGFLQKVRRKLDSKEAVTNEHR